MNPTTDEAEGAGYPDATEIAIARITAWDSSDNVPRARAELARLGTGEDLGRHRAKILLLHGDIAANRFARPDDGVAKFEQARALGELSPADDLYAQAVLAPTVDEAIPLLQRAMRLEPSNRRVLDLLGNLAILSGRKQQALEVLQARRLLYPHDPSNVLFEGFVSGLEGDFGRTRQAFANAEPEVRTMLGVWLPFLEEATELIRGFDHIQLVRLVERSDEARGAMLLKLGKFLPRAVKLFNASRTGGNEVTFRVTPAVGRVLRELAGAMGKYALLPSWTWRGYADALREAGRVIGDGFFDFAAGVEYLSRHIHDAAEECLARAERRGSAILRPLTIRLYVLEARGQRMLDAAQKDPAALRGLGAAWQATADRVLDEDELNASVLQHLYETAKALAQWSIALETAVRWRRIAPDDVKAKAALDEARKE